MDQPPICRPFHTCYAVSMGQFAILNHFSGESGDQPYGIAYGFPQKNQTYPREMHV